MKKSVLRAYARLIAESGVNVQKGQEVFITAGLDQPEFVAMVVEECYRRKTKKVVVDWNYQPPVSYTHLCQMQRLTRNSIYISSILC